MQKDAYSKRYGGTGQWVLETPEFQSWLKSKDSQHSTLWCPGNPGVGKTVATSIAVNHNTKITSGQRRAIVYIYCDYANVNSLSETNLLGSLLRQLVAQTSHAETIAELKTFMKQNAKNRNMTEEDLSCWIDILSRTFDVVYTLVDALDECPEIGRDTFLTRLQQYSEGNMRIFLTSRFNVDVRNKIPHAIQAEISATRHDITDYVESKICGSSRLTRITSRDPELKQHIIDRIVTKADGMFLLAGLQIECLGNQTSVQGIRSTLERLPTDVFTMYDQTIERIRNQPRENADLGLRVLSLMFGATRLLRVDELCHALAIQPGDTWLDFQALADVETLFSVTAGLVINHQQEDDNPKRVRLVHYTLQEYLELNRQRLLSDLDLDMARVCMSYLSLGDFRSGQGATYQLPDKARRIYCFLCYAVQNWAHHLRRVQTEHMDQGLALVEHSIRTSTWLQAFEPRSNYRRWGIGLTSSEDVPLDPLFVAAQFRLPRLFTRLASSRDIDTRNSCGETPLIRAVNAKSWNRRSCMHFLKVSRLIMASSRAVDQKSNCYDEFPLRAMITRQPPSSKGGSTVEAEEAERYAMVQSILDLGASINAKDSCGMTAAFHAVMN